jgi:6-phosphogluconolactonase
MAFLKRMKWRLLGLAYLWVPIVPSSGIAAGGMEAAASSNLVFIGTYTGPRSQGIYVSRFDSASGALSAPQLAAETKNPSFLALHPNGKLLYAVGELNQFEGKAAGAVSAFKVDPQSGHLALLNQQPSAGTGPCYLSVDSGGRCVLVANYGSGSIAALPIMEDGRLGPARTTIQHAGSSVNPQRQAGPHAHFIVPDPPGRRALVCDLGLDQVLVYQFDPARASLAARASLVANDPPFAKTKPGAGPRHLAFHPDGSHAFVVNEMGSSVTAFDYDQAHGGLKEEQTVSTLPENFTGDNACAEIQVHPKGKVLYASNRGHDSIAVFDIEGADRKLKLVQHEATQGKTPRFFTLDPTGNWLLALNQGSDSIVVFRLDAQTGRLSPAGHKIEVGSPVCALLR